MAEGEEAGAGLRGGLGGVAGGDEGGLGGLQLRDVAQAEEDGLLRQGDGADLEPGAVGALALVDLRQGAFGARGLVQVPGLDYDRNEDASELAAETRRYFSKPPSS